MTVALNLFSLIAQKCSPVSGLYLHCVSQFPQCLFPHTGSNSKQYSCQMEEYADAELSHIMPPRISLLPKYQREVLNQMHDRCVRPEVLMDNLTASLNVGSPQKRTLLTVFAFFFFFLCACLLTRTEIQIEGLQLNSPVEMYSTTLDTPSASPSIKYFTMR